MSKACQKLHEIVNKQKRFYFPFDEKDIYENDVYILFEKGEKAHGVDRIVRIGTHTGNNNLRSRLKEHFIKENKDRSIFRKNIGRAILNKSNDDYLKVWNIDFTTRKNKGKFGYLKDEKRQESIEKEVSSYIRNNFMFTVLEEKQKNKRLLLESMMIATVFYCCDCGLNMYWLGKYSPKRKIAESGLWQVNSIKCKGFDPEFLNDYFKVNTG